MPSVAEVVAQIEKVGLVVQKNPSKHSHTMWDIVDPKSGTILTGISGHADKQGGDHNWHFNIRRILRKAGFQIEFGGDGKKKKSRAGHKRKPAIDLDALKRAQDQAIAAGHRPPLLEDIEGEKEFLTRSRLGGTTSTHPYSDEATGEVIDDMTASAEAPRVYATVERLKRCLDLRGPELSKRAEKRQMEKSGHLRGFKVGSGATTEFVRIAMEEVAPQRGLRAWKSLGSAQQTMHTILTADKPGMSLWTLALIEATIDHLDGLKWNEIDPDRIKAIPPEAVEGIKVKRSEVIKEPDSDPSFLLTPPQEGPDQTTYDVAIAMIEEYEETFRLIAEKAGADGTDPEDWRALVDKPKGALNAVIELRKDHDEALDELTKVNKLYNDLQLAYQEVERQFMQKPIASPAWTETNPIANQYATVLLELLQNFDVDKQGNAMLDMIFTRLDKLAGF